MKIATIILGMLLIGSFLIAQAPEMMQARREVMKEKHVSQHECEDCDHTSRKEQVGHRAMRQDKEKMHDMAMMDRLELTENQKDQMKKFRYDHQMAMIDLKAEVAKLELQMKNQMDNNEFRAAKRTTDQLHNKKAEIAKKMIDLREKMHQVLTEEQRQQLKNMHRMMRLHRK